MSTKKKVNLAIEEDEKHLSPQAGFKALILCRKHFN